MLFICSHPPDCVHPSIVGIVVALRVPAGGRKKIREEKMRAKERKEEKGEKEEGREGVGSGQKKNSAAGDNTTRVLV